MSPCKRASYTGFWGGLEISLVRKWNELPQAVKQQQSVNSFKSALDRWVSGKLATGGDRAENLQTIREETLVKTT